MKRSHRGYDVAKRLLDVAASLLLLIVLSPVLLAIAIVARVSLGRPVLFVQERPGLGGETFRLYKFRSMRPTPYAVDAATAVSTDADRLTGFGRFLRAASLDELPQLWNVLVGDMSLVGPRPLLAEYLPRYNRHQARRHEVRPGITGWAQVNGRNATTWEERFEMDVYYVDHRSLSLDLRIIGKTISTALRREGVSAPGAATMQPFDPGRADGEDQP